MSDKRFDQKRDSVHHDFIGKNLRGDEGSDSNKNSQEIRDEFKKREIAKFSRRVGNFFIFLFLLMIGYYVFNLNFYRTIDCTVVSAEASGGGGGLRSAGSYQRAYVQTEECGEIIFVRMQNEGFDTTQDLADELNHHRGEKLTFRVSYLDFGNYEARAVELEGFPIRD